jgi:tetratricopeptide (TPR) repeat protein
MIEGARVRLEQGTGHASLSLCTEDGRWVRLHSLRNPIAEADAVIAPAFASTEPELVIVIGLGLGYVLDAIEARSSKTRVLALEPLPASVIHMMARRDWSAWQRDGRLRVLIGPDYAGAAEAWTEIDAEAPMPPIIVHPVLAREATTEVRRARELVERITFGAQANLNARKRFASRYLLNILKNLPTIVSEANVGALFGLFPDIPAIIASAGPSLDQNLAALRGGQDRALLIAVDTAVRPLLSAGIDPHLVVSVDPSPENARHLAKLPDPGRTWLAAEGSLDRGAFVQFAGRIFTFKVSDHHPWPWLRGFGIERDVLRAWGSVATSAFDLAIKLQCRPIVFVGQDLAYTNGRPYCRGTTFEENWARAVASGQELPDIWAAAVNRADAQFVDDIHGEQVLTTNALVAFRNWISEQAVRLDRRVINASAGGILLGPGIDQADLASLIASLAPIDGLRDRLHASWNRSTAGRSGAKGRSHESWGAAIRRARDGSELAAWAAFANVPPATLAAELDAVADVVDQPRATLAPQAQASASDPRQARTPEPGAQTVPPPERVRALLSALREEAVPDWAQSAAATIDSSDPNTIQEAFDTLPPIALYVAGGYCERQLAFEHAAALYSRAADAAKEADEPALAREAELGRFRCLFVTAQFDAARELAERESLMPEPLVVASLSKILQLTGGDDVARARITQLIQAHGDVPGPRIDLAMLLAMRGRLAEAFALIEREMLKGDESARGAVARGICLRLHGDYDTAVATLEPSLNDHPSAAPELLVASIGANRPAAADRALRALADAFAVPLQYLLVPKTQSAIALDALSRMASELARIGHHLETNRVSDIGLRLFARAANAWKPKWDPERAISRSR